MGTPKGTLFWVFTGLLAAPAFGQQADPAKRPRRGVLIEGLGHAASRPAAKQPAASQPAASQPAASQPAASQPAASQPALPSWAPSLRATVKPASCKLGDPVVVSMVLTYRKGISVTLPLKLELGDFSELSRSEHRTEKGPKGHIPTVEHRFELKVGAYKLGQVELPPIEINALGPGGALVSLHTNAMPILIVSAMPNEPNPKLKDVEPPVSVFVRTWWLLYLLLGLALVAIVATVTLVVARRIEGRRKAALPPPPPTPPHVMALKRLAVLELEAMLAEQRFKDLYLELSEIVREYVGGRWGFDALEMTTFEINEMLQRRGVPQQLRQVLSGYFNDCDLVKFAKYRPEAEAARAAAGEAERIVRSTMQVAGGTKTGGGAT